MYKCFFKRFLDIIISMVLLVVLSPVFVLTLLYVYFFLSKKPFFTQVRPGKDGQLFKLYKFKSMSDEKDGSGELLPDSQRLTVAGNRIRRLSLDEIPQLFNVLKGEMSLIGPRPLLEEYLPLYNLDQKRRHEVKPGITGWAQVNGRNMISWEKKFELDVFYVDNQSLMLDLRILFMTALKVLRRDNISPQNREVMPRFDKLEN